MWPAGRGGQTDDGEIRKELEQKNHYKDLDVLEDTVGIKKYIRGLIRKGKYSFPHFFKINGEYVDFDLMNLERNETDDKT